MWTNAVHALYLQTTIQSIKNEPRTSRTFFIRVTLIFFPRKINHISWVKIKTRWQNSMNYYWFRKGHTSYLLPNVETVKTAVRWVTIFRSKIFVVGVRYIFRPWANILNLYLWIYFFYRFCEIMYLLPIINQLKNIICIYVPRYIVMKYA